MALEIKAIELVQGARDFHVKAVELVQGVRDFHVKAVELHTIGPTQNAEPPLFDPVGGLGSATTPTNWQDNKC